MVDKDLINAKVELIQRDLERLEELRGYTIDEIVQDFYKWSALKLVLVEIIGRATDINCHIIAEKGNFKEVAPPTMRDTFIRLGEMKIFPPDFAMEISKSASFRNKIVHEYNSLNENTVYKTVDEALRQYTEYCKYILKFLEEI